MTLNRAPAVGQSAEVTVTLDSKVDIDRAQLSIRLPQGLRITSDGFSAPQKRGLDAVVTRELKLDESGDSVSFTVTADQAGPAQIEADVVDLANPIVQHTAHATEEITVGTTAGTSRKGLSGNGFEAQHSDGITVENQKTAGKKDAARQQATAGRICATGYLTYATYRGDWKPGRRFTVAVKGQRTQGGTTTQLASGLTDAVDGSYQLCFDHDGASLPKMWVEFSTTSPFWVVTDMKGTAPYHTWSQAVTDVPVGTTQSFGRLSPGAAHMPAFDAYDVHNEVYDVRGSGTGCWTMAESSNCSRLKARWAPGNENGGYYDPQVRSVFLTDEMPDARHPVVHEAGHNFQHLLYNWTWGNGDCPSPHALHRATGPWCGWTEGFPNAIAGYVMGDGRYYYTPDTWMDLTQTGFQDTTLAPARTNPDNAATTEGRVAGAMIALWRELDGGPQATFRNMDQHYSDTFEEWFKLDRAQSNELSVGEAARDILYRYTIDYRNVPRQENIVNGGLENQGTGWTWDNGVVGTYRWETPRTGSYYVWMGGNGSAGTDTLSQSGVTIPANGTTLLDFHLKVKSTEPEKSEDDTLKFQVIAGGQTTTLYTWLGSNKAPAYTKRVIDLSRFAGQTVTLRWVSTEDDGEQTDFLMDDFSVYTTTG
ncbi:hypothetical protein ACWGH4_09890 [Streptomyces sp. NPDC054847]